MFFIEINVRNKKWLLRCLYNLHKNNVSNHIFHLSKGLDNYYNICHYDNILFLGDFNSQLLENCVDDFCNVYDLSNLVKKPTCLKNPDNPSCIDLFLTNRLKCFQKQYDGRNRNHRFSQKGDYSFKIFYKKQKPKIIHYRNYKTFNANLFQEELNNELLCIDNNNLELAEFTKTVISILEKYAPIKTNYIRANNSVFMKKVLRTSIMQRSKLKQKNFKREN